MRKQFVRRFGIPVVVVAATAALAMGGYAQASDSGNEERTSRAAYEECIRLVRTDVGPDVETPTGKLVIKNDKSTTVVVANSTDAYTCNVRPDSAVSYPEPLNGSIEARDFWFALNYAGNYIPGAKGDIVWAGGEAPEGVTAISYTFPNGATRKAVVRDGHWAVHYISKRAIPSGPDDRVVITVEGENDQTFELPFNINTQCNQVSHGC